MVVPYLGGSFSTVARSLPVAARAAPQEQLDRGELRPIFLYDKVRTRKIDENEIRRFDPEGLSFLNMNSPAEYEAALRLWEQ